MGEEVKPCPFCAGSAQLVQVLDDAFHHECFRCGAATEAKETEDEAVAAWNRRAASTEESGFEPAKPVAWRCRYGATGAWIPTIHRRTVDERQHHGGWEIEPLYVAPTSPESSVGPMELSREEALQESSYLAGMKAGWNFGIAEDQEGYAAAVEARAGYLKPIADARRAGRAEARTGQPEDGR